MSKRPLFNRQRVFSSARPRRLVSTFLPVLLGLSILRVFPILSVVPISPDVPPTFAQSPRLPSERSNVAAVSNEQNQAVFFSIPVAADVAIVRSGPSEDAYPTGSVGKNRYVEAYFRDADGWCAIRPPQGSFSWINAKFVRRENESTGRVVASNGKAVPARVGGATVEESAIVQVGLKNGRQIKILGETRLSDGSTWLKIAPPSGEFRWLRASDLLDDPAIAQLPSKLTFQREFLEQLARASAERSVASSAPNANLPTLESAARAGQLAQNTQSTQNENFGQTGVSPVDVVPETLPASVVAAGALGSPQTASTLPNAQSSPTAPFPQINQNAQTAPTTSNVPTALSASSPENASLDASEEFATEFKKEIARLNADVFQTLRQNPPSDADLAALATRAERLFDAAPTDGERFVVQSIYDAIKIAERRNRSRSNGGVGGAPIPFNSPISPNAPNSPVPTDASYSPLPAQSPRLPLAAPRNGDAGRFGEFEVEGDLPTLVLPDSNFDASVSAASVPFAPNASNGFAPAYFPQTSDFNASNGVSSPWNAPNNARLSNIVPFDAQNQPNATASEKRPRLAFAFSDANAPFRSRSKTKEVRVAPFAPQSGERSSGLSKLPPLFPTQKQLIVPPPNYRSGPFGKNDRANDKSGSAISTVAAARPTSEDDRLATPVQTAQAAQITQTTQELTVDSVRWRAVEPNALKTPSSAGTDGAPETSTVAASALPATSNALSPAAATAKVANTETTDKIGKASSIGATISSKPPVLTGAAVPKTVKKSKNGAKNADKNAFQPVSSRNVASFDAYGVLAKLPKAPQGTPQYALTRPVGDRFEIVSYLEAERNVSLESYVGRKIGVKGTRGTVQIGKNTQKLTTVQTVFAQE
ncbi:MAG: hypothetical protein IKK39_03565 [Thermoguttaceae bacterium]|nr:hypothetical protein [Thermoguttaceae bacterium]MBR4103126.1 hypothetical protein [Thermoguttaceae bacterium]